MNKASSSGTASLVEPTSYSIMKSGKKAIVEKIPLCTGGMLYGMRFEEPEVVKDKRGPPHTLVPNFELTEDEEKHFDVLAPLNGARRKAFARQLKWEAWMMRDVETVEIWGPDHRGVVSVKGLGNKRSWVSVVELWNKNPGYKWSKASILHELNKGRYHSWLLDFYPHGVPILTREQMLAEYKKKEQRFLRRQERNA